MHPYALTPESKRSRYLLLALVCVALLVLSHPVFAATNGSEFKDLYDMVHSWSQGYFGKALSICFLLVGLSVGIVRGSIIGCASCLGAAISLLMAPNIIDAMFGIVG